jgi:hypothetical protein
MFFEDLTPESEKKHKEIARQLSDMGSQLINIRLAMDEMQTESEVNLLPILKQIEENTRVVKIILFLILIVFGFILFQLVS